MAFARVADLFLDNKVDLDKIRDAGAGEGKEVALEAAGDSADVVGMLGEGSLAIGRVEVKVVDSAASLCAVGAVGDDV